MTSPQDPTWGGPNSQYFDDAPTVVFAKIPSEPESADGDAKSSNPETHDKEPKPALTATDTKPRHFKATMKRLLSLLQPHKFAVFCVVVATIASIATLGNHIATAANAKPQVGAASLEILSAPKIATTTTVRITDAKYAPIHAITIKPRPKPTLSLSGNSLLGNPVPTGGPHGELLIRRDGLARPP